MNFEKSEIFKMWILWIMRLWQCEFWDKWDFRVNVKLSIALLTGGQLHQWRSLQSTSWLHYQRKRLIFCKYIFGPKNNNMIDNFLFQMIMKDQSVFIGDRIATWMFYVSSSLLHPKKLTLLRGRSKRKHFLLFYAWGLSNQDKRYWKAKLHALLGGSPTNPLYPTFNSHIMVFCSLMM